MPGACCTRGLVCKSAQKGAHEHTGTVGAFRHSLRNGFTAYGALPGDEFVLPPSLTNRWLAWPGWALQTSASLTPATGARTTRFCRPQLVFAKRLRRALCAVEVLVEGESNTFVWRALSAHGNIRPANILRARHCRGHRIPHPTSVTIAIRPSGGAGWPGFYF